MKLHRELNELMRDFTTWVWDNVVSLLFTIGAIIWIALALHGQGGKP